MRMIKRTDLLQDPPSSIVYDSHRGENQLHILGFPQHPSDGDKLESSSPVLLAREPCCLILEFVVLHSHNPSVNKINCLSIV